MRFYNENHIKLTTGISTAVSEPIIDKEKFKTLNNISYNDTIGGIECRDGITKKLSYKESASTSVRVVNTLTVDSGEQTEFMRMNYFIIKAPLTGIYDSFDFWVKRIGDSGVAKMRIYEWDNVLFKPIDTEYQESTFIPYSTLSETEFEKRSFTKDTTEFRLEKDKYYVLQIIDGATGEDFGISATYLNYANTSVENFNATTTDTGIVTTREYIEAVNGFNAKIVANILPDDNVETEGDRFYKNDGATEYLMSESFDANGVQQIKVKKIKDNVLTDLMPSIYSSVVNEPYGFSMTRGDTETFFTPISNLLGGRGNKLFRYRSGADYITEAFSYPPTALTITQDSGGVLGNGSYKYKVTYVYANGAESNASSDSSEYTVTGSGNNELTVTVGRKPSTVSDNSYIISAKIYRAFNDGTGYDEFRFVKDTTDVDGSGDFTYVDDIIDASTSTLYVEQDLINLAPSFVFLYKNTLFALGDENYKDYLFPAITYQGHFISTDSFQLPLKNKDDKLVCGIEYNDSAYCFSKNKIYRVTETSSTAPYYSVQIVSDEFGCIAPLSLVRAGNLLYFMSTQGYCVFDGYNIRLVSSEIHDRFDKIDSKEKTSTINSVDYGMIDSYFMKAVYDEVRKEIIVLTPTFEEINKYQIYKFYEPAKVWNTLDPATNFASLTEIVDISIDGDDPVFIGSGGLFVYTSTKYDTDTGGVNISLEVNTYVIDAVIETHPMDFNNKVMIPNIKFYGEGSIKLEIFLDEETSAIATYNETLTDRGIEFAINYPANKIAWKITVTDSANFKLTKWTLRHGSNGEKRLRSQANG